MINLERLGEYRVTSVDTETDGLHWYRNRIFGVAVAGLRSDGKIDTGYWDIREQPLAMAALRDNVKHAKLIVNHNVKFDSLFLRKHNVHLPLDRIECTQVRAALINEHEESFSLDALCLKYIKEGKPTGIYEELAKLFGGEPTRKVQMANLHRAPERLAAKYAMPDPALAIKLWLWQEQEIERQGLQKVWDLERRLTPVLINMEARGVRVDEGLAAGSVYKVDKAVMGFQDGLDKAAGKSVNANSSTQMRALFAVKEDDNGVWRTDSGHVLNSTDGGEASIGKESLMSMAGRGDERARCIIGIRKMLKAKTFLKDHILGHAWGGRVHPNINQTRGDNELGTGTGRFSMNDPALQQIPARDKDIAAIVRPCFIPDDGHLWCSSDYKQFEQRWFAHYAKDPAMLQAFDTNPDSDYYQVVSDMTGIPRNPVRAGGVNCKQLVLGLIFGMSAGRMALEVGLPYTTSTGRDGRAYLRPGPEAQDLMNKLYEAIPGIRRFLDEASAIARSRGYVKTVGGRHIRFPGGKFTHKAGGLVLQGSAADSMKMKMIEIHSILRGTDATLLLSVHDEINLDVPPNHKQLTDVVSSVYTRFDGEQTPIKCRIPITCNLKVGKNWYETSKK